MARADKATAVADIVEQFSASTATVITEYRGLTVANLADLRRSRGKLLVDGEGCGLDIGG